MDQIRYGVIGLGHIAQSAVLPAFKNAKKNSKLVALISSDPIKLKTLSKKYKIENTYMESEFMECIESRKIDALYIATPNTDHQFYAEKAIAHGIHVLCEKPLATTVGACRSIAEAVNRSKVKFMVGYRLHFDPANLRAIELAKTKLGELRYFSSTFSFQVKDIDNIRLQRVKGGGPINDIGIYCMNAARYLFSDEPVEVFAQAATPPSETRFRDVPEMVSVQMRFPKERFANFICSFGAADSSTYTLVGTKGSVTLDAAYEYESKMELTLKVGERKKVEKFSKHDQFAAEIIYFSDCILKDKNPEPSVIEGLADLSIIQAIDTSIRSGKPTRVEPVHKRERPTQSQKIKRPAITPPDTIHVISPSGKH